MYRVVLVLTLSHIRLQELKTNNGGSLQNETWSSWRAKTDNIIEKLIRKNSIQYLILPLLYGNFITA